MAEARVSQIAVEVLGKQGVATRVSQVAVEILGKQAVSARVAQVAVEVLGKLDSAPSVGARRRPVYVIG